MTETEKRVDAFVETLKEAGVSHFVIAFCDPDENSDFVSVYGSRYWRAGVGMDLMAEVKGGQREEKEEEQET